MKLWGYGVLALMLGVLGLAQQAEATSEVTTAHARVELLGDSTQLSPGETITLGLRLTPKAHWHTYWRYPGEVGLPTRLNWTTPESLHIGETDWPVPERFQSGDLVSYGYSSAHVLLIPVTLSAASNDQTLPIAVHAKWLICEEQCVPEEAQLELKLTVGPHQRSSQAGQIDDARKKTPQRLMGASSSHYGAQTWWGTVEGVPVLETLDFYPATKSPLRLTERPQVQVAGNTWSVWWPTQAGSSWTIDTLSGLFVEPRSGRAWMVSFPVTAGEIPNAPLAGPAGPTVQVSLWGVWGLAFLGGLLLNLMPCVLPVLSLKVVALIREHPSPQEAARQGLAFLIGVLVSFWLLVAALLILRAAGHWVGWGFHLQSPWVVSALSLLFTVLTLNFWGRFEWGDSLQRWGGELSLYRSHSHLLNSFLIGVLTTIVATPCTAPFLGAGIGYTLTQSSLEVFATFTAMALGVALPVTLATVSPRVLKILPKPGAWMDRLKHLLAIPMALTVLWLLWVLSVQKGWSVGGGVALGLLALVLIWTLGERIAATIRQGLVAGLIAALLVLPSVAPDAALKPARAEWQPYSDDALIEARAAGHPVFVDFTAAWCLSCQVNLRTTLQNPEVVSAFKDRGVVLLEADWTDSDPVITRALERLHRNALPVYALYPAGSGAPQLLPEVLTPATVELALKQLTK